MASDKGSVEARLQRIEDLEDIRRLRLEYHRCVNKRVFQEAARLYTDDAYVYFDPKAEARGKANIAALYVRLNGNLDMIVQYPANHIIDLDGDTAIGNAYVDARYAFGGNSIIACAMYDEKYRRTPEGWRIAEMLVTVHFAVPITEGWGRGGPDYAAY